MDVFPSQKSSSLIPPANPGRWEPFESLMVQGRVQAFVSYMDVQTRRIFHHDVKNWSANHLFVDNFRRSVKDSKKVKFFSPEQTSFKKASKKLQINPLNEKKTSDQRMNFKMDNMLLVKQHFSFGLWTTPANEGYVFQTTDAPMLIYRLTDDSFQCTPKPSTVRRSFFLEDEWFYKSYVMRPNSTYVVPPGIRYLILTVQKTLFAVDVMNWEYVNGLMDFRSHTTYTLAVYNLPPPTPSRDCPEKPKMVRPEERLGKPIAKRRKMSIPMAPTFSPPAESPYLPPSESSPPAESLYLPPSESSPPAESPYLPPSESSPPAELSYLPTTTFLPPPESSFPNNGESIIFLEEEAQHLNDMLNRDVPQEAINNFLEDFEREMAMEMPPPSVRPAHAIHLDAPSRQQPPLASTILPPPPIAIGRRQWNTKKSL